MASAEVDLEVTSSDPGLVRREGDGDGAGYLVGVGDGLGVGAELGLCAVWFVDGPAAWSVAANCGLH